MIAFLRGLIFSKGSQSVVIDVNGVGYEVVMASSAISALGAVGDEATVFTYMQVREDGVSLFGFTNEEEKFVFEKLITVSGVGPKVAISALSAYPAKELIQIISTEDNVKMAKVPGIGKKTAQRIIIDLKNTFEPMALGGLLNPQEPSEAEPTQAGEATLALLSMGFTSEEAKLALSGYTGKDDVQELIRYALKRLGTV